MKWRIPPARELFCDIALPGDKSICHRAVMLGALAEGVSHIQGFSGGDDNERTLRAFQAMGVQAERPAADTVRIHGCGLHGLSASTEALDMGNSGTGMRLLAGLLCAQSFASTLVGDASLSARPMLRVVEPLRLMGGCVDTAEGGCAPLHIHASKTRLKGGEQQMQRPSAQVKSALLLAGLYADSKVRIVECATTRDHTEIMLRAMGASVTCATGEWVELEPPQQLQPLQLQVPGDISAAAFLLVAASIAPEADVWLRGVNINPTRDGVLRILKLMGADIEIHNELQRGGEAVADLHVVPAQLHGVEIPQEWVPLAIDEFPALLIAAACAEGETYLRGAGELRVKETDRLAAMTGVLKALGVAVEPLDDGLIVRGGGANTQFSTARVEAAGDHRIAMASAIAALRAGGDIVIDGCEYVATSWPEFSAVMTRAGVKIL